MIKKFFPRPFEVDSSSWTIRPISSRETEESAMPRPPPLLIRLYSFDSRNSHPGNLGWIESEPVRRACREGSPLRVPVIFRKEGRNDVSDNLAFALHEAKDRFDLHRLDLNSLDLRGLSLGLPRRFRQSMTMVMLPWS